jgi:hypothetical protein
MQYFGHIESGTGAAFDEAAYQGIIKVFAELLKDPVFGGFDPAGDVQSSVQEVRLCGLVRCRVFIDSREDCT